MSKYVWLMVLAVFVAGCAGGGEASNAPVVTDETGCSAEYGGEGVLQEDGSILYKICSLSFAFEPQVLHAKVGQKVVIESFTPDIPHSLVISEFDVNERLPSGLTTFEFTPDQEGSFDVICTVPGHKEAGMVGVLEVEA